MENIQLNKIEALKQGGLKVEYTSVTEKDTGEKYYLEHSVKIPMSPSEALLNKLSHMNVVVMKSNGVMGLGVKWTKVGDMPTADQQKVFNLNKRMEFKSATLKMNEEGEYSQIKVVSKYDSPYGGVVPLQSPLIDLEQYDENLHDLIVEIKQMTERYLEESEAVQQLELNLN